MMRLKLTTLALAVMSCVYMTTVQADDDTDSSNKLNYPKTRVHQDSYDPFLHGEFGISANTAGTRNAQYIDNQHAPDDGIDHYSGGTHVDKYRWLEKYDNIDAYVAKETDADRERNFIGTRFEDDRPLAAETTRYLQTVQPRVSSEVNEWVNEQNAVTEAYIQSSTVYDQLKRNYDALKDVEHTMSRFYRDKIGEIRYYRHVDGFSRIERIDPDGTRTELVNQATISPDGKMTPDGNAAVRGVKVSKDGSYVSFFVRQGFSDVDPRFLHVIDTRTGELATPIIKGLRRDILASTWLDDDTLFYVGSVPQLAVYRRDIGKERFIDPIETNSNQVGGGAITSIYFDGDDDRYLVMDGMYQGTTTAYIKDRKTGDVYRLHDNKFFDKAVRYNPAFNNNILAQLIHFDPETRDVWFISGENDRRGELIKSNLDNLKKREVVVNIPQDLDLMRDAYYHEEGNGYFLVTYLKDGVSRLKLVDATTGVFLKDLTPPQGAGFISELTGNLVNKEQTDSNHEVDENDAESNENYVQFRFENPTFPPTDYKYSIAKDEFLDIRRFDLAPFDETQYESKVVFYTSYDGTQVPMNISYKKGIPLDGKNPTLLYGYGGYGVIYDQTFGFPANTAWLENGGVWAHAFIRGGGEYGQEWQDAAKHTKRLTGYDDFAAAADYLNQAGYANPDHLGIIGGSNGGLLVGAAMVRHPEKYRVAFPQVAVLDQLRQADMGITQYWMEEYGVPSEGRRVYDVLMSYSPYHNLNAGTCYPSTLVQTSKRDDRVVPSHSYKFVARFQEIESCGRPALLHAAENQGHSPNTYNERKEDELMTIAFAFQEMGVTDIPNLEVRPTADEMKTDKWRAEDEVKRQKRLKERSVQ
ncbi:prolyl oligopeptidase family serine peptidase [Moraxella bovis]|uniref:Prolyl endopeptidase n=1 Tax=Moraxella bovis TaxID=476 RepID=A0A378PPV7_MORBO|nr:prolyl oligopeptidase family serine peptidase [Moraxella bovis]UYZ81257.1 prolyl oligopeptidase family serine peptidase [Moraxella bovis]UYZ89451.1 prolyl oligopeptidase family serine peptidase [Moraxella bovis]UYZ95455.1 prolyl oligopeptidase family serine peptidase [Moraxella bovis]UZA06180.1 prolyl oligopeptidase family serine peptidase [Moraxella bovis]UZA11592.1 prolyl oligopeptidase family serine peptidase [Moraxella bovis]